MRRLWGYGELTYQMHAMNARLHQAAILHRRYRSHELPGTYEPPRSRARKNLTHCEPTWVCYSDASCHGLSWPVRYSNGFSPNRTWQAIDRRRKSCARKSPSAAVAFLALAYSAHPFYVVTGASRGRAARAAVAAQALRAGSGSIRAMKTRSFLVYGCGMGCICSLPELPRAHRPHFKMGRTSVRHGGVRSRLSVYDSGTA